MKNIAWSNEAVLVYAHIRLGHQSFTEICYQRYAVGFTAQKKVRNALQELRKLGAIHWNKQHKRWIWHINEEYLRQQPHHNQDRQLGAAS